MMHSKRQELILKYLCDNKTADRDQIEQFLSKIGISTSKITILRDLDLLINNNFVEKLGKARATSYQLSKKFELLNEIDIEEYFSKEQEKRNDVKRQFNFDIFPLLFNLLTAAEKEELTSLNDLFRKKRDRLSSKLRQKEFERITIELAWKSSRIEGNTYSLLDTERLLKENIASQDKTAEETQMILNHKTALDFVLQDPSHFKELTIKKIEELHQLLTKDLGISKGIRQGIVGIIGTEYRPLDNVYQIQDALIQLISIINRIEFPLEKALIAVLMISYIQPFEDGNKRTSRILGNAILMAHNYCPLSYRSINEIEYKKATILFYEQNNMFYFKKLFLEQFRQAIENYF